MKKVRSFQFKGKTYDIFLLFDGQTYTIRVYLAGTPANGLNYQVTLETRMDINTVIGDDILNDLIDKAQQDVENGLWEKIQKWQNDQP